jgi:hypothetical protein
MSRIDSRLHLLVPSLAVWFVISCKGIVDPGCGGSYCGTITLVDSPISVSAAGFGYQYTGHLDLRFDPAPPAGLVLGAQLNGASIDGSAVTNGSNNLRIDFSGSSVACQLTNPSTWVLIDVNHPQPALTFLEFNWERPSC